MRHSFENSGKETAHRGAALRLQESIEDGAALAAAEKLSDSGAPKSLRALVEGAALAQRYRETVVVSASNAGTSARGGELPAVNRGFPCDLAAPPC